MKIETTKERLDEALGKVARATTKQSALPVLSCVFFDVRNGELSLKATNLDFGIEATVPVKMTKAGTVAVPGSLVQAVVASAPPESVVSLSLQEGNLSIQAGGRTAVVKAVPHDDFPVIPRVAKDVAVLRLDASLIADGLRSVWYSASPSGLKPELSSVLMTVADGALVFAATDAFRLAEKRIQPSGGISVQSFGPLLVPFKNAAEIMRLLDDVQGMVDVVLDGSQMGIYHDAFYITSRVVDGVFPDYRQIIPREHSSEVVLLKRDFLNALKGVTLFADTFHQVRMAVLSSKKNFSLTTKNDSVGQSTEAIPSNVSGEDIDTAFNYRYLLDCFQSISDESVVLRFGGPGKPLVIQGVKDRSFLYLVMPMNT